jgi:hypothetical protein
MLVAKMKTIELVKDEDTGELILPLDDKIFAELGWNVGDTVEWTDNQDGTWTITKAKKKDMK